MTKGSFFFFFKESGVATIKCVRGRSYALYSRVLAARARYIAVCFGGAKYTTRQKRQKKTSMSRSDAETTRALPDGFLIPLLFSRSSAICDVKKPNLIIRSGQMSELTHSCDNCILFFSLRPEKHQHNPEL